MPLSYELEVNGKPATRERDHPSESERRKCPVTTRHGASRQAQQQALANENHTNQGQSREYTQRDNDSISGTPLKADTTPQARSQSENETDGTAASDQKKRRVDDGASQRKQNEYDNDGTDADVEEVSGTIFGPSTTTKEAESSSGSHRAFPLSATEVAALKQSLRPRIEEFRQQDPGDVDPFRVLLRLVTSYINEKNYDQAIDCLRLRGYEIEQQLPNDNSEVAREVAGSLCLIGYLYGEQNDIERGLRHLRQAAELARQCNALGVLCQALSFTGGVLYDQGKTKDAVAAYQDALEAGRAAFGTTPNETVSNVLDRLGTIKEKLGDEAAAIDFYQRALQTRLALHDPADELILSLHSDIARLHRKRSEYGEALEIYGKILALQKEHSSDPLDIAYTQYAIAQTYRDQNHLDNALEHYCEELRLLREHSAKPLSIAETLHCIGRVKFDLADYVGAVDAHQESLQIRREFKGDDDEDVALSLVGVAKALMMMEIYDTALNVLLEAYRVVLLLSSPDFRACEAYVVYHIAFIYQEQGRLELALPYFRETIRLEGDRIYQDPSYEICPHYNTGSIYYQFGEMDAAMHFFTEALVIEKTRLGPQHGACGKLMTAIGNVERHRGNYEEAMRNYVDALRILRAAGEDESNLICCLQLWRFEQLVIVPAAGAA